MIRAFSATGTKDEVIGKLRELKSAGYSHCTIGIRYGHPEMVDEWGEVIAAV
jgi:hypothetical protein